MRVQSRSGVSHEGLVDLLLEIVDQRSGVEAIVDVLEVTA